jgi:hypothetical protein
MIKVNNDKKEKAVRNSFFFFAFYFTFFCEALDAAL